MQRIGFVGLGTMGRPMARNVMNRGGYPLTVYDLVPQAVTELVAAGAQAAASPAAVAAAAEITILMVPNSADVEAAVLGEQGLLAGAQPGSMIVDMSTIDPATEQRVAAAAMARGVRYVDSPVGRSSAHAERGELLLMVGGDPADVEAVRPVLMCMGNEIIHCGPVGQGQTAKVVNNLLTTNLVLANAEALVLGTRAGLELETMLKVLRSTAANNGHLNTTFPAKALKGDFTPGFMIRLALKDMTLAAQLAKDLEVPLPLGAVTQQFFMAAKGVGKGSMDFTGIITVLEEAAGCTVRG